MGWPELKKKVERSGYVITTTMGALRNTHGSAKLGVHVRKEISKTLARMGLGHIPEQLPKYQHEQVRVYKKGTPIGELIHTVVTPGRHYDRKLKAKVADGDHAAAAPKGFKLQMAFKKAIAAMRDPTRTECKHGHPITLQNANIADLKRTGRYSCDPCIKMYAVRRRAPKTENQQEEKRF